MQLYLQQKSKLCAMCTCLINAIAKKKSVIIKEILSAYIKVKMDVPKGISTLCGLQGGLSKYNLSINAPFWLKELSGTP